MKLWQKHPDRLFDKIACFTDIHYGRRGNDTRANQDNSDFVDWFIDEAKAWGADVVACLGDWHDNRNTLNVATMNYSLRDMEKLSKAFNQFILINGNHDLMYREHRQTNSVEFGRNIENCFIVREPITQGGVTFMPWLIADEWEKIPHDPSKYIFGHFELPFFFMNGMTEMPDHGGLNRTHFKNQDYAFSGHFHKRQAIDNVVYIGNPFPTSYSDSWDDDRGMMLLEWGKEPDFKEWPEAPKYRTMKVSEMMENPSQFILPRSYNRASIDVDISYEEAQFIRETFVSQYQARKIELIPLHKEEANQEYDSDSVFQSIDQIVEAGLESVQSAGISSATLIEIYRGLQ